jgi:type IV pilus assembly protein PilM
VIASLKGLFARSPQRLGIELTPERVNFAHLSRQAQIIQLNQVASVPVPDGVFQEGRILDPVAMAETIRSGMAANHIKIKQVASAISVGEAIIRLIRLPAELDDFELREVVLYQEADLYLPFPREEADLDFQKLGTAVDEDGLERVDVLLVATPREVTQSYLDTFQQAGLRLESLEVSNFALLRILRDKLLQIPPGEAVALIDLEFDGSEISIVQNGIPQFNRRIPVGTHQLQNALGRAMNLPTAMGADLLQGLDISLEDTRDLQSSTGSNPVGQVAIRQILNELADELRRSIEFYLNQGHEVEINQGFLAGPGAGIHQLDQFLTHRLNLNFLAIDPIESLSLQTAQEISPEERAGLGVVIGLGLRGL